MNVSYIVNKVFSSRTYILLNKANSVIWLVDCGDVDSILARFSSYDIKGVLLTHTHYDHIYGLPHLAMNYPHLTIFTNTFGKKALSSSKLNMSKYHDDPISIESDNVVICDEGTEIELYDGIMAKVYYTPGHNPSCLTYEIGEYLFTGDAYIPDVPVVTILPGGNKSQAKESETRILSLAEEKIICPGHEITM